MPDLDNSLDDLLNTFAEADRPAARDLITRNAAAQSHLTSRETVYRAFVDNDPVKLQQAAAGAAGSQNPPVVAAQPNPANPANPPASPLSVSLDQVSALFNEKVKSVYTSPEFTAAVETLAEKKAQAKFEAERANVIGAGAEISDTISSIRENHLREFNEPLDSAKFREYYAAEGPKHGNRLLDTYNAYVSEKRTEKKIADGIAAGLAAQATASVPGSAVPGVGNPLAPNFVDHNMKVISPAGTAAPSADADKAAQAFAQMRQGWTQ